MVSHIFYLVITCLTGVTPISSTLIENIFSNRVNDIESIGVIIINISDHCPVFSREIGLSLADNVLSIKYIEYFLMKICLILEIHCNTETVNQFWTMVTQINPMNYYKVFYCIFIEHFPLQTKNICDKADQKPWMILTSIHAKRRLKKVRSNKDRFLTTYLRRKILLTKLVQHVSNINLT